MHLDFQCPACENVIHSDFKFIGEWVACPCCSYMQVVPEPVIVPGTKFESYTIKSLFSTNFLWSSYIVSSTDRKENGKDLLFRLPSSFVSKNIRDYNSFFRYISESSRFSVEGLPFMVEASAKKGKSFFVYEIESESFDLMDYIISIGPMKPKQGLVICRNIAEIMGRCWKKSSNPHFNVMPQNIVCGRTLQVNILDSFIYPFLLADSKLIQSGFNLWDKNYMCPEFLAGQRKFLDPSPDMYSLGRLLFFILIGEHPFDSSNLTEMQLYSVLAKCGIPESCLKLMVRLICSQSDDRYRDWDSLIFDLNALIESFNAEKQHINLNEYKKKNEEEVSTETSGLTGLTQAIKLDKKQKQQFKKQILKIDKDHNKQVQPLQSKNPPSSVMLKPTQQKVSSQQYIILAAGVAALLAIPLVFYFISKPSAPPPAPPPKKAAANKTTQAKEAAPVKEAEKVAEQSKPVPEHKETPVKEVKAPVPEKKAELKTVFVARQSYSRDPEQAVKEMVADAKGIYASDSDRIEEVIQLCEAAYEKASEANNDNYMNSIDRELSRLNKMKEKKIAEIINSLGNKASDLMLKGKGDEAANLILEYNGPLKESSRIARMSLLGSLNKNAPEAKEADAESSSKTPVAKTSSSKKTNDIVIRRKVKDFIENCDYDAALQYLRFYNESDVNETSDIRTELEASVKTARDRMTELMEPFIKSFATAMLTMNLEEMNSLVRKYGAKRDYIVAKPLVDKFQFSLDSYLKAEEAFMEEMKTSVGKKINISLAGKGEIPVLIANVSGDTVFCDAKASQIPSFTFKDLLLDKKLVYISKDADQNLAATLFCMSAEDYLALSEYLSKLPMGLGQFLAPVVNDYAARNQLELILKNLGIQFTRPNYSAAVAAVKKKYIPSMAVGKLIGELNTFKTKYGNTEFVKKNKEIIDALQEKTGKK